MVGDKDMVSHIKTPEELTAAVKRDGNKVWIEGVPDGTFGISWDMLTRAMQTLLEYRGEKADIDEMLDRIIPPMRARGGYIPTCDHGVPEEVTLDNYLHYRRRCVELGG